MYLPENEIYRDSDSSDIAKNNPKEADIILYGGLIVTMDKKKNIYNNHAIVIKDGDIIDIDEISTIKNKYTADKEIDARNKIVMPGLINTHTHAAMSIYRGIADDLPLMDWLNNYIFPAESKNTDPELVYYGTLLSNAEYIKSGTTTFVDMYYFEDKAAEATKKSGMRAILGETILDFPSPDSPNTDAGLKYAEEFIIKYKNDELITPAIAPHAPYTCSPDTLIKARNISKKYEVPFIIHLSETRDEVDIILKEYGSRPVEHLIKNGILSIDRDAPKVIAAHCVWVNDKEIELLREYNVGVAHNPESNMKLASGVAPITQMYEKGVAIGLGTDGAASNNDLDMFGEMHSAALIHKVYSGDPTVLPAKMVVEMATIGGAKAIGMDNMIGSLEIGKKADLIILSTDSVNMTPMYNVYSHIVYSAHSSDVETTIINGNIVMEKRDIKTFDVDKIKEKAQELSEKVKKSLEDDKDSSIVTETCYDL